MTKTYDIPKLKTFHIWKPNCLLLLALHKCLRKTSLMDCFLKCLTSFNPMWKQQYARCALGNSSSAVKSSFAPITNQCTADIRSIEVWIAVFKCCKKYRQKVSLSDFTIAHARRWVSLLGSRPTASRRVCWNLVFKNVLSMTIKGNRKTKFPAAVCEHINMRWNWPIESFISRSV